MLLLLPLLITREFHHYFLMLTCHATLPNAITIIVSLLNLLMLFDGCLARLFSLLAHHFMPRHHQHYMMPFHHAIDAALPLPDIFFMTPSSPVELPSLMPPPFT